MRTTLKLVAAKSAHRETIAWYVPGRTAQTWLAELDQWNVPLESLWFRPISRSIADREPIGVLVTLGPDARIPRSTEMPNWKVGSAKKAIPYAQIAGRLFIPIDADIVPEIDERELADLLPGTDCDFVWHPSAGLIRFEESDRQRITDFLECPGERFVPWDRAVCGDSFRTRLISVEAEEVLSAEQVLNDAASDIGSQGSSLDKLPPTPDEPFGGKLNEWTRPLRNALRNFFKRAPRPSSSERTSNQPKQPGSHGDIGSSSNWVTGALGLAAGAAALVGRGLGALAAPFGAATAAAGKMLDRLGAVPWIDQLARNREIDRLMHLLRTDPDKGLQFALPMGGENSRGTAVPSNELVARPLGFNLDQLGGGSPADTWDIPADQQYLLIQQYRELAAREIRLGRHRRAAYIFAHLLADIVSAAGALEAGHHYREAAVLYRDRLQRPGDAARCFERAGLLDEAALLFIDVGLFEQAADIYERLERHDEAERLLRSWAAQLINNGDYQNASRVFHDKLNDVDSALEALSQGWPASKSAMRCFEESFRLLGLHARHVVAHNRIGDLGKESANYRVMKMIVEGLARVSASYPEQTVRAAAVDSAQVVASRALKKSALHEVSELLDAVRRLAPQDHLLARDCSRYVRIRQPVSKPAPRRRPHGMTLVKPFWITLANVEWQIAKSTEKSVYVAGFGNSSLVLQRLDWESHDCQNQRAFWAGISDARKIILEPFPGDAGDAIVHAVGADPIEQRGLPRNTGKLSKISKAGSPSWATKSTVAMTYGDGGGGIGWRIREVFGTLEIATLSSKGEPLIIKDLAVPFDSEQTDSFGVTLYAAARRVRIGVGQYLCRPKLNSLISQKVFPIDYTPLDDEIRQLSGTRLGDDEWLIALFGRGGILVDDDDHEARYPVGENLESPCVTFLAGGRFVIAGTHEVQLYEIVNSRPRLFGESPISFKPIAVTRTNKLNEFAVFGEDGSVEVFRIDS